jgi:hypothetical protein
MTDNPHVALGGDRTSPVTVAVIALLAGAGAASTGAAPTGQTVIDAVETVLAVAAMVWFGCRAPWWAQVGAAAIAAAVALSPLALVLGISAFAIAAWVSPLAEHLPARRLGGALSVGLTANSLVRADVPGPVWVGAAIGVGIGLTLIVTGMMQTDRPARWPLRVTVAVALVSIIGFTVAALIAMAGEASDAATEASTSARRGLRLARDLETDAAAAELRSAASSLREVEAEADAWWLVPSRAIPVVAQHRAVGSTLGGELAEELDRAADALELVDIGSITSAPGQIDVGAVRALEAPIDEFVTGLERLVDTVDQARSVWLVPEVADQIDTLAIDVGDAVQPTQTAQLAIDVAPAMLGETEPRHYLLLFTTPAEARGLGGFIGNYGVLEVDDGALTVTDVARRSSLEEASESANAVIPGPADMLATYGRFGLVGDDGTVGPRSWSNLTMEPHWPSAATAAIELFNQSGLEQVDGVLVMDVYVLETLLRYTGPIERPGGGRRLNRRNLADYLLLDQYTRGDGQDERTEALGEIASDVISTLLRGELPPAPRLATDLGPLVDEQRLLMWATDPEEQTLLARTGLGAGLPVPDGRTDQFSLALDNAGASKIDAFLRRDIRFERQDTDAGFMVDAMVRLTNDAPASGLPDYVIGNSVDLPDGSSRLYLVAYTTTPMRSVTVDGVEVTFERGSDAAHHTSSNYVVIPPGDSIEIVYRFPAIASGDVVGRLQPLVEHE